MRMPARCSGRLTIGHSRLPVETIARVMRGGTSFETVRAAYPSVTADQFRVMAQLIRDVDSSRCSPGDI